jgi:Zn-dependent protease
VNFVIAGLLWPVVHWQPDMIRLHSWEGLIIQVFVANLVIGIFNLVPVFPSDIGRILRALLVTRLNYLKATFVAASIGKFLSVGGILFMPFSFETPNYLGALLFLFIFSPATPKTKPSAAANSRTREWLVMLLRLSGRPWASPPVLR